MRKCHSIKLLLPMLLLLTGYNSFSQQIIFQKSFKAESTSGAGRVCQTKDGGYLAAGTAYNNSSLANHVFFVKTDSLGLITWRKLVFVQGDGLAVMGMKQTRDGGFVVIGSSYSWIGTSSAIDFERLVCVKIDPSGNAQWVKQFQVPNSAWYYFKAGTIDEAADGGLLLSFTVSITGFSNIAAVMKTDSAGNPLWRRYYGGATVPYQDAHSIAARPTTDNGIIIVCQTRTLGAGNADFYLIKADSSGAPIWARTFGTTGNDMPLDLQQTTDGGFILAGGTVGTTSDVYLVKTDAAGNINWYKSYGTAGDDIGRSVSQTSDGGYVVTGNSTGAIIGLDLCLVKTNSAGTLEWGRNIGSAGNEFGWSVQQTSDQGFVIGATTQSFGNGMYVIKTDSLGAAGCNGTNNVFIQYAPSTTQSTPAVPSADTFPLQPVAQLVSQSVAGLAVTICPVCPSPVPAVVSVSGPTTFCDGDSVILTASHGVSYSWSNNAISKTIKVVSSGSYTVTIADSNGCKSTSQPIVITIFPKQTLVITSSGPVLSVSPASAAYQWYLYGVLIPGATGQSYSATQSGIYIVQATDSNGCTAVSKGYSFILGVDDHETSSFSVYPNPSAGTLSINVPVEGTATLISMEGVIVSRYPVKSGLNQVTFPGNAAPGVYMLSVVGVNGSWSKPIKLFYQP